MRLTVCLPAASLLHRLLSLQGPDPICSPRPSTSLSNVPPLNSTPHPITSFFVTFVSPSLTFHTEQNEGGDIYRARRSSAGSLRGWGRKWLSAPLCQRCHSVFTGCSKPTFSPQESNYSQQIYQPFLFVLEDFCAMCDLKPHIVYLCRRTPDWSRSRDDLVWSRTVARLPGLVLLWDWTGSGLLIQSSPVNTQPALQ